MCTVIVYAYKIIICCPNFSRFGIVSQLILNYKHPPVTLDDTLAPCLCILYTNRRTYFFHACSPMLPPLPPPTPQPWYSLTVQKFYQCFTSDHLLWSEHRLRVHRSGHVQAGKRVGYRDLSYDKSLSSGIYHSRAIQSVLYDRVDVVSAN